MSSLFPYLRFSPGIFIQTNRCFVFIRRVAILSFFFPSLIDNTFPISMLPFFSKNNHNASRSSNSIQLQSFSSSSISGPSMPFASSVPSDQDQDSIPNLILSSSDDTLTITPYLLRLTLVACLGGLQFGIDTGIASGMLVSIKDDLEGKELSSRGQELVVASTTAAAILAALIGGKLADWAGRKKVMILSSCLFFLGCLEQAASQTLQELVLGRALVGLGVGFSSHVVPTFLGEVAPPKLRGQIVGINSLLVTGGQLLAYVIGASLYKLDHGWRYMAASGAIPALVQLLGLFALHESPRWNLANGKVLDARRTLERIYPQANPNQIDAQIDAILTSLKGSNPSSRNSTAISTSTSTVFENLKALLFVPSNRIPLILSCGLMFSQQATGFNSLMYFSSPLLLKAGFKSNPTQASILIALANFIGTAISMKIVDRIGRRKLLLRTILGVIAGLGLLGWSFFMLGEGDEAGNVNEAVKGWAWLSLISMVLFTFSYSLGLGIIPWLVQSEVFSGQLRGLGSAISTATNWTTNLIISSTYLDWVKLVGASWSFWIFGIIGIASWFFTYHLLPELSGVSINDVNQSFDNSRSNFLGRERNNYQALAVEADEGFGAEAFEVGDESEDEENDQSGKSSNDMK